MSSHTEPHFASAPLALPVMVRDDRRRFGENSARRARTRLGLARWLAWVALAVALGLSLTFLVQLGIFDAAQPKVDLAVAPARFPDQISGGRSRISGFDKNNLPFEINAEKGVQDKERDTLVHLSTLNSTFQRPTGAVLTMTAASASYETKMKSLELSGDVVFAEGQRFRAHMDKAAVNMNDQTLTSKSPVSVDIIGGRITADSLTISANGERILFKGGVKASFVTKKPNSGDGE